MNWNKLKLKWIDMEIHTDSFFLEIVTEGTTYSTQIIIIKYVDKKTTKGFYIWINFNSKKIG